MISERDENVDVWKFYKEKRLLGKGSMGTVCLVKRRSGTEGGSAYADAGPSRGGQGGFFGRMKTKTKTKKSASIHSEEYALKSIHLTLDAMGGERDELQEKQYRDELRNEIDIIKSLDHPNIVKAYEVYECSRDMHILMEYCSGGALPSRFHGCDAPSSSRSLYFTLLRPVPAGDLFARAPYTERQAADVVSQLCAAISYMHNAGVAHRDLKFENIMFESRCVATCIGCVRGGARSCAE